MASLCKKWLEISVRKQKKTAARQATSRVEHANEALWGESAFAVRGKAQTGGFFNENQAHEFSS